MKLQLTIIFLFITFLVSTNDKGVIEGVVVNSKNNEPIPFANILF